MNNLSPTPIKDLIPDIQGAWKAYKEKRIKVHPQNCLRASSIGHTCDRYHYHSIKNWQDRTLHDAITQSIFDEGYLHEADTIKQLIAMGFEIVEQQRSFQYDQPTITGHIDGIIRWEENDYPFDVKSINPYDFDKINSAEDLIYSKKFYQRQYPAQLQMYLFLLAAEFGCFILKNKLTGELKPIWMQIDIDYCDQLIKRAERVYKAIAENNPPKRTEDYNTCNKCPYKMICLPDLKTGEGIQQIDDVELFGLLERREQLSPLVDEFETIDEKIKDSVKASGVGEKICGNFLIKVTEIKQKKKVAITWEEQESSYLKTQILRLNSA